MIYPNIDKKRTEKNTVNVLKIITELFEINVFTLKEVITVENLGNKKFENLLIVNVETEYKYIAQKIMKSMDYLNWTQKYIIFNRFFRNISLSDIKLGIHCKIAVSNVYTHYHKALFELALLTAELIVYKET